jgi:hypothetical protein
MSTPTPSQTFYLPRLNETFSVFPNNGVNPYYSECRAQSKEWANPYYLLAFRPDMRSFLENCDFELMSALVLPYANPDGVRASMDCVRSSWHHIWAQIDTSTSSSAVPYYVDVRRVYRLLTWKRSRRECRYHLSYSARPRLRRRDLALSHDERVCSSPILIIQELRLQFQLPPQSY